MNPVSKYFQWLHGQWPAGTTEALPIVQEDGTTNREGIRVVGDLSGVPLLKFSSDTGAKAVQNILKEENFNPGAAENPAVDVAIIGGGVSGISAAIEAEKAGLSYILLEAAKPFNTIKDFPKKKPIYTYPTEMKPAGGLTYEGEVSVKESLLAELQRQREEAGVEVTIARIETIEKDGGLFLLRDASEDASDRSWKAQRVIVAIGRSGNYRQLGVPGEDLEKVTSKLLDGDAHDDEDVLVIGGGDSALEAAAALQEGGARVTVSYRKNEFSRAKPENIQKIQDLADSGKITLLMGTEVSQITPDQVHFEGGKEIQNDHVFTLIGREAPLDFFRRSGLTVAKDKNTKWWITLTLGVLLTTFIYHWKKNLVDVIDERWISGLLPDLGPGHLLTAISNAANDRSFYYSLAYCLLVLIFGLRRIRRRNTPYVTRQTLVLNLCQWIPLFILPYLILPWMGANGWFQAGAGQWFAETFFSNGKGEGSDQYWRAFGFVLAWPLFVFNVFTEAPLWGWLVVSLIQTFVIIPLLVHLWGKGSYCGWICSCGALAETMGDANRHKMPHGPIWNKVNMIGQLFLLVAFLLLLYRILGWVFPESFWAASYQYLTFGYPLSDQGLPLFNYAYFVDLIWAGILGTAFYFHFSGRVWCRFACPLAALMHIYQKAFGRFRIFAEKKKCISCNVCTSVCHQGIDVMSFANRGKPMEDPQCVRCSACVQSCPTGVLSFGRYTGSSDGSGGKSVKFDSLPASLVQLAEERRKNS